LTDQNLNLKINGGPPSKNRKPPQMVWDSPLGLTKKKRGAITGPGTSEGRMFWTKRKSPRPWWK